MGVFESITGLFRSGDFNAKIVKAQRQNDLTAIRRLIRDRSDLGSLTTAVGALAIIKDVSAPDTIVGIVRDFPRLGNDANKLLTCRYFDSNAWDQDREASFKAIVNLVGLSDNKQGDVSIFLNRMAENTGAVIPHTMQTMKGHVRLLSQAFPEETANWIKNTVINSKTADVTKTICEGYPDHVPLALARLVVAEDILGTKGTAKAMSDLAYLGRRDHERSSTTRDVHDTARITGMWQAVASTLPVRPDQGSLGYAMQEAMQRVWGAPSPGMSRDLASHYFSTLMEPILSRVA